MVELVVATRNKGKLAELRKMMPQGYLIRGLDDIGCSEEIPETGSSFEENALQKVRFIASKYHCNCLADDSGLEVAALNGAPGIFSARYAGPGATDQDNIRKLLGDLNGETDRSARFVCCIALIINNKEVVFRGEFPGVVSEFPVGNEGFGYDPIFIPSGSQKTLAEHSPEEKNRISHRAVAMMKLAAFLGVNGRNG